MAEPTTKRKLKRFPGLEASQFQHPSDAKAIRALKQIPGLDKAVAKIMEYGFERVFYLDNVASNVRVTERMFPRLHRSMQWASQILDVDAPELYVTTNPQPNAYTWGHKRPFVVLTSGLVDMMSEEECFFVIGHELGHLKAGHPLYSMLASNIAAIVAMIGQATLGIGGLLGRGLAYALLEWQRMAELTADRAGLLCVQDLDPAIRTFMKLSGGAISLYEEMDQEEFLRQADEYEEEDRDMLNRAYKLMLTAERSHPYSVMRAKELTSWHGGSFEAIIEAVGETD